jgi:hypothetical protein
VYDVLNARNRKARVLFGLSDIALTALSFWAAYETRAWLPLERYFSVEVYTRILLMSFAMLSSLGCETRYCRPYRISSVVQPVGTRYGP